MEKQPQKERRGAERKQCPAVDASARESKAQCCKEQHCLGTRNVTSRNQGKLEVVKQEMPRLNTDSLGISELKWTGMGECNSTTIILLVGKNPLEEMEEPS